MKKNNISNGLSIIIPCFNVEEFIENCLDSLKKQLTKVDYEIILIDDCSKDNTVNIIEKYIKENDMNILFIKNEKNCGAGYSRNRAVEQAKYDYISFIDADDYVDDNYYDEMYGLISVNKADVVVCDINIVYEDGSAGNLCKTCDGTVSKFNLINNGLAASPCNKIIKKELLLKYPFGEGIMNEDIPCVLSILANCDKAIYTNKTKYYYIQHSSSVQNSPLSDKKLDVIKAVDLFLERLKGNPDYDSIKMAVIYNQLISFFLYVPIKEKSVFKRSRFLRKFNKLTKKYGLRQNGLYANFVNSQGIKTRLYYKTVFKLTANGLSFLASLCMSIYRLRDSLRNKKAVIKKDISDDDLIKMAKRNQNCSYQYTLSVSIPNYNYKRFLYQRVYSVLSQKYKINELIILDDCSTDDSRKEIDKIVELLSPYINIKKVYNETNSGSPFKQWRKSFEMCNSDYLWIAEADDYCGSDMILKLMNLVNSDDSVTLGYVDTAFIDVNGKIIMKTIKPEIDLLKTKHWDESFINNGIDEIRDYAYLNCTIANVSSVVFKKLDYSKIFDEMSTYKQVGDYLFYVYVMSQGNIAFINEPLNYYRVHGNNVTSTTKKQLHLDEIKRVHSYIENEFGLSLQQKRNIGERYNFLERVWELKKPELFVQGYDAALAEYKKYVFDALKANNVDDNIIDNIINGNFKSGD